MKEGTGKSCSILVIDNYDSFTFNLVQYLQILGAKVDVCRNDEKDIENPDSGKYHALLLSPGPGCPDDAQINLGLVKEFAGIRPLLGVCLGHQAIAAAYGGKIIRAGRVMHGKISLIHHDSSGLFSGLASPFKAVRYNSLLADPDNLPDCLRANAWTDDGEIMGITHRRYPIEGLQFHPEAILSENGFALLDNWLKGIRGGVKGVPVSAP